MLDKAIYLTEEEQLYLKGIIKKGVHNSHVITRARVLLMLDRTGKTDHVRYKRTAESAQISVQNVRSSGAREHKEPPGVYQPGGSLRYWSEPYGRESQR